MLRLLPLVAVVAAIGVTGARSATYDLSGVWTNPDGAGTTITISQKGSAFTWVGGPNNHAWIQNFSATLNATNSFSGTFWQDAPGVAPQRYHGTIDGAFVDNCHMKLLDIVQTGQTTLHDVVFTKQSCTSTPPPSATPLRATISSFSGEVEYRHGANGSFSPLTSGVVLHEGDFIATGYDSTVTLDLGYGTVHVFSLTQLRIDEFLDPAHLGKSQIFLNVGSVEAKVKHVAAIRSDFGIRTKIVSASIRGSEMVVTAQKGTVSVFTVSDVAYVQGSADKKAIALKQGFETTVGASHKASKPLRYSPSALPVK